MGNLVASILIIGILLANLAFIVYSVIEFKRDWPVIYSSWNAMEAFEKRLLYMGVLLFILVPALKEHSAADWYFVKVIIEIIPVLAGSFFVAGVLAFMRQVHEFRKNA